MKATTTLLTIVTLLAGSAVATNKPSKPSKPTPPQQASIDCGSDAGAYCCNNDNKADKVTCSHIIDNCKTMIICCNNVVNNGVGNQKCAMDFDNKPVVFT